jgi:hypothetical protein
MSHRSLGRYIGLIALLAAFSLHTSWTLSVTATNSTLTKGCLWCICQARDCQLRVNVSCVDQSCGPYYITESYYQNCNSPGDGWESCTMGMTCSQTCVVNYLNLYGPACTPHPTCRDYARIHWSESATGCQPQVGFAEMTLDNMWQHVSQCCNTNGGC